MKGVENRFLDVVGVDSFFSMILFGGDGFVNTICCSELYIVFYFVWEYFFFF